MLSPLRPARPLSRRQLLGGGLAATAGALAHGCRRRGAPRGRLSTSLWFTYGGRNREVLQELVTRFNEGQGEYFVEAVFQGDYFEGLAKLRTALAARAGPTLSHVIGEVVPYLASTGTLEVLGGYPGAHDLGVIPELGQTRSWVGGDQRPLYVLPFNRSTPIAYLNGDHLAEVALQPPSSWQQLRHTARALTRRRGSTTVRHGFGCPIAWWFWVALTGQAGGTVIEPTGAVTLGADAGVEALQLWQTLVHEDRTMKPPPGRDYNAWEATNQDFLAGRTSMIWTSTAFLKYLESNARFPVLAAPLPGHRRRAVPTGGTHWVMMKAAPGRQKEAAWAFLRFMHEPAQVVHWAISTGYMPVTYGAVEQLERERYFEQQPNAQVAYDQLSVALPWPWSTELFRIQREIVQPRLEQAVLAGTDAARVLAEARRLATRGQP